VRLFVALPLPPDLAARAASILPASVPALRRVVPENLHLTLAFLGETPESRLADVAASVADAAREVPPFPMTLERVGPFPERRKPHAVVLAVGEGTAGVEKLAESVRRHLKSGGLDFDEKPLAPHVTLARLVDDADAVEARTIRQALRTLRFPPLRLEIAAVAVVQSVLGSRGPHYTVRSTQPLGEPHPAE
jgi:2'-5' RNA ligase